MLQRKRLNTTATISVKNELVKAHRNQKLKVDSSASIETLHTSTILEHSLKEGMCKKKISVRTMT